MIEWVGDLDAESAGDSSEEMQLARQLGSGTPTSWSCDELRSSVTELEVRLARQRIQAGDDGPPDFAAMKRRESALLVAFLRARLAELHEERKSERDHEDDWEPTGVGPYRQDPPSEHEHAR